MKLRSIFALVIILSLSLAGLDAVASVGTQGRAYRASEAQMRRLIRRIETRADQFGRSVSNTLDRGRRDGTRREDEINRLVADFRSATDQLRARFDGNSLSETDVRLVLERAAPVNTLIRDSRLGLQAERQWVRLRADLDQLAGNYDVAWDWNNPPTGGGYVVYDAITTGTYRLNVSQSDDPRRVADAATRGLAYNVRRRINDSLVQRLNPPETLAVERRGMTVTLASTRSPRVTFEADGREHAESYPNGRASRVRASLSGDVLTVVSNGDRANDFTVTIDPSDNGRRLLVTRSLYAERLDRPVVLRSYYDRISDAARLDLYNPSANGAYNNGGTTTLSGNFVVPDGTQLVAVLDNGLNTRYTREGDIFTLNVRSPAQYAGAVISGRVSDLDRSGRATGRSEMTLNYDTIRLRDGRTFRFAGFTEGVRTTSGEVVRVDNEGTAEGDNRTDDTVTRTAIGTAVGAIIGAIAGGGKGAAIGAAVGAGAGAGSVYVQGREDLALPAGTEITVRASAPR